jgi:glycosyltransferase involved in cell wall biosynthesis
MPGIWEGRLPPGAGTLYLAEGRPENESFHPAGHPELEGGSLKSKRILYFQIWSGPPISASVKKLLEDSFPDHELIVVTLWDLIKSRKSLMVKNLFFLLKEYGLDILQGKLKLKAAFFRTTYLFDRICEIAAEIGRRESGIVFTFQLQSIFDCHIDGIPHFVYTDHTHLANLQYSPFVRVNLYSAEWICREKLIYDHAARIFTRSSNITRSLVDQYGIADEKVRCIYAGANTPLPVLDPGEKDYSARHILFVGLDWKRKGGPDLLEAFKRVKAAYADAVLTIVGEAVDTAVEGVVSTGRVSVGELSAYFRQATVFCMPSYNEPFGVVFVEAMAYELPIVATDIGAVPDMVVAGSNGYLVEPGDVDGLVYALSDLLGDAEKRSQFGKRSLLLSKDRYNWDAVSKLLIQYIEEYWEGLNGS